MRPSHAHFLFFTARTGVHPTYAFWEICNSSCVQSIWTVYLGDRFCMKINVRYLLLYLLTCFLYLTLVIRGLIPSSALSLGWEAKQGQNHSSQELHCLAEISSWGTNSTLVVRAVKCSPKMCTVLWVLEEIDQIPIPSSLHFLFLQKLLKHFMLGKDAEFFIPRGKKFVKGYLYSWNCESLEISLSLVLAQAALCSPAANILS